MEIKIELSSKQVENIIKKQINDLKMITNGLVDSTAKTIESGARRNFNNARGLISSDYDYVNVTRYSRGENEQVVSCTGDQVLFIEFGAGENNKSSYSVHHEVVGWHGEHIDWSFIERPAFGFTIKSNVLTEIAPRPTGIVPLGSYGKGQGKNDYWVRPSVTGIPNYYIGESRVHIKDKSGNDIGVRSDVVWTKGHPPMRALWRAINSARKTLHEKIGGLHND